MRRVPAAAAVLVGLLIVVGVLAMSGVAKAGDGQTLIEDAAPTLSEPGLASISADRDAVDAASRETVEQVFPAFARELGISDAEFEQRLRASHPEAAAAFLDQRGPIFASIDKAISNLAAHQGDYEAADALPTSWIQLPAMAWITLAAGLGLLGLGVWAWLRPGRGAAAAVALAGMLVISGTLVAHLPGKSHRAERLLDSIDISQEVATTTRAQFETFASGTEDLREVFTELAEARGQTPEELGATVREQLPAIAAVVQDPAVLDRIEAEVVFRETHIEEFGSVEDVPLELASWVFVGFGAGLVVAGGLGLLAGRGRPAQPGETGGPV